MDYKIREATIKDVGLITKIYNEGIEDRIATLETRLRDEAEMVQWTFLELRKRVLEEILTFVAHFCQNADVVRCSIVRYRAFFYFQTKFHAFYCG